MTQNRVNNWATLILKIKKRYKKKFKRAIKTNEIKKIWDNWINSITQEVIKGGEVKIDKHSSLEIIGIPIMDDKIFGLLKKGKSIRRDGSMKNAEFNGRRQNVKYKIVYKNKLRSDVRFKAHPDFAKLVHETIENTNNYYTIK